MAEATTLVGDRPEEATAVTSEPFASTDSFARRHIGPSEAEVGAMLASLGLDSLDALLDMAIPETIRLRRELDLPPAASEHAMLAELRGLADRNQVWRSYLGMGYHDCVTPPVILRNILENPGWYTAYTPYQPEISQGRLEMLLNFQTAVIDLTGLPIANASLLDEATAAAEGMAMAQAVARGDRTAFLVAADCHPQTVDVVRTRARARGWDVRVSDPAEFVFGEDVFGALVQYPATDGAIDGYGAIAEAAHEAGALLVAASDLLALTLLTPPGEWGADVVVGSAQRFGVPLGYGGPHAAFFATREDFKRQVPGRIIGLSQDDDGQPALRMALQTREQHIRRERATSNVCTAQVLLAVTAAAYAVYHGPDGLRAIAARVRRAARVLAEGLRRLGHEVVHERFFDTVRVRVRDGGRDTVLAAARQRMINLRAYGDDLVVALDETVGADDLADLLDAFGADGELDPEALTEGADEGWGGGFDRTSPYLTHPVFSNYRAEHEMLRYLKRLETRDLSLTTSMIPLGSCTMKLNAAAEMLPITWRSFGGIHPFAPVDQADGYRVLFGQLESWLAEITGFAGVSLQPNAGSQGELTGLLVIRAWHESRGESERDVCLIPASAHGTNPASAVMAGMRVVVVKTDERGNVDLEDLEAKAAEHADRLGALMITYPSTHGIFEEGITRICQVVHGAGGQVYLDGANMNAMVGVARPGDFGADVCHLNLHKTFCIPHGGGGPGMGPIGVAEHLVPFLPGHPVIDVGGDALGAVAAAPWGSPSILPISWAYIRMLGADGLRRATEVAILAANYVAERLDEHFPVLYRGTGGHVAHECIIDPRPLKAATGVDATDIAKRLMDYGFHAPTLSFPVAGTLMIEPTESESKAELDRFCDALVSIREEIARVESGELDAEDNPLRRAPHTARVVTADAWGRPYSRELAAYPSPATREHKFWPAVGRVDSAYGDRNLVCACPPIEEYTGAAGL
ncbi:MAG TPA: aminomethyl-transferring glycine dehydrogenase [Longimicrobiales bacterium]|nr:aminomethyl-transferring glycine dehydrogenase [Longimicrobiales bacterium]